MRKAVLLICIFALAIFEANMYAQTIQQNLEKYWFYRDRLRKYFVVVDPNDDFGTNIPFTFNTDQKTINTGDGNDQLQYYIGMLATEYALLKRYGKDITQTRNELLYALRAVVRLDKYAESYFRVLDDAKLIETKNSLINNRLGEDGLMKNPDISRYESGDLNGFFVRDDFGISFPENWSSRNPFLIKDKVNSTFLSGDGTYLPYEESKDNIWNYIPNLALVVALVDDPEIKLLASQITYRMVMYAHGKVLEVEFPDICPIFDCGFTAGFDAWVIKNPVVKHMVNDGAMIEEIGFGHTNQDGFNWGFACAAQNITNINYHYSGSEKNTEYFIENFAETITAEKRLAQLFWYVFGEHNVSLFYGTKNSWLGLGTVAINNSVYQSITENADATVMDRLLTQLKSKEEATFEHLPLIRLVLDKFNTNLNQNYVEDALTFTNNQKWVMSFYDKLLKIAPNCGNYNVNTTKDDSREINEWGMSNRLTMSDKIVRWDDAVDYGNNVTGGYAIDNGLWFGIYNGIDYLLLHNLYWLALYDHADVLYLTDNDVDYYRELALKYEKGSFMEQHYTNFANFILYHDQEGRFITSARTIPSNYEINYTAAEGIELLPGFTADAGSCFEASIQKEWIYSVTDPTAFATACNCDINSLYTPSSSSLKSNYESNEPLNTPDTSLKNVVITETENKGISVDLQVIPNPSNGNFTLTFDSNNNELCDLTIIDMLGKVIVSEKVVSNISQEFRINNKGIYIIEFATKKAKFEKRLIIN